MLLGHRHIARGPTSFELDFIYVNLVNRAGVAELVDAQDLKSCVLRGVRVRFPPSAPLKKSYTQRPVFREFFVLA